MKTTNSSNDPIKIDTELFPPLLKKTRTGATPAPTPHSSANDLMPDLFITDLLSKIKTGVPYLESYFLTDTSNKLLSVAAMDEYKAVEDPLQIKLEILAKELQEYSSLLNFVKTAKPEDKSTNEYKQSYSVALKIAQGKCEEISASQRKLENLMSERVKLNETYQGLFQAIPRKLIPSFIQKWKK